MLRSPSCPRCGCGSVACSNCNYVGPGNAPNHDGRSRRAADSSLLDWLEKKIVDVIYLDDHTFIDVRGNSVRDAIKKRIRGDRALGAGREE